LLSLLSDSRKWVGGEVLKALAYDVPIPGYKTKNAISLRLWEAKATAEDFNLFQFNDGQYESSAQLHARAEQVIFPFKLNTINFHNFQRLNKE
jgi:glycogen phosphorylase